MSAVKDISMSMPRVTSRALAMRPQSRRILMIAAALTILGATVLGAAVAYVGDLWTDVAPEDANWAALWGGVGAFVAATLGVAAVTYGAGALNMEGGAGSVRSCREHE